MTEDDVTDLRGLLDRSFGDGPAGMPAPEHRLRVAQRARRRKRGATTALTLSAGLAVALVTAGVLGVGVRSAIDSPSDRASTSSQRATPATDTGAAVTGGAPAAPREPADTPDPQALVSSQFPAALDTAGTLVVKKGWRVAKIREEPMGFEPPEASLGVVLTSGSRTRWMLLTLTYRVDGNGEPVDDLGTSQSADDPGGSYADFEDWLASQVSINGGAPQAHLITIDSNDGVVPTAGVDIVAVREMPVIDDYTRAGDRAAEVRRDDQTWFVIIRGQGPEADLVPVDAAVLSSPTFAALVEHVRDRARLGQGLR